MMLFRTTMTAFALAVVGWLGSADASANLLLNPGFDNEDAGPAPAVLGNVQDWIEFNTTGVTKSQARPGSLGDQSLRIAPNAPTGNGHGIVRQEFPAAANEVYNFSAWVMHPGAEQLTGPRTAQMRLQWRNASDTLINQVILDVLDQNSPTNQWIFVEIENIQLPDNPNITQVWPSLFVTNNGGTGGGAAYFDDVSFTLVPPPPLTGDLDGDGFVGINDLNIVLGNWNQNVPPADPLADPSGDGFVGINDLNVVLGNWNAGTPPPAGSAVPEPASIALLSLGGLAVLGRRHGS